MVLYGNHSTWWDGYLASYTSERLLKRETYTIVEDTQLRRYQFFRWIGAFSVSRSDGASAMASIRYANQKLHANGRALLIFPQGKIVGNDVRPLKFSSGVSRAARGLPKVAFVPIGLRFEFVGEQRAEAFVSLGQPIVSDLSDVTRADERVLLSSLQQALTSTLDTLRDDVTAYRFADFDTMLSGPLGINRWWDALRGKPQIRRLGPDE